MKTLNILFFAATMVCAGSALANQYRCVLTDPTNPTQKETVYIEPSELESFLRLMQIQGIQAKCTRVQDA